jgi:hypothetical protein
VPPAPSSKPERPTKPRATRGTARITAQTERHLVIDGRAWRRTDPAIPEPLRKQLVAELMGARRAVQSALRQGDPLLERAARARVHDAKVALGERGAVWWEQASEAQQKQRAAAAMRALLRQRGADKTICPSEVARAIGGASWRASMPLMRQVALALTQTGELEIRQQGKVVAPTQLRGPIRLALPRG